MNYYAVQVRTRGEEKYLKIARYLLDTYDLLPEWKGRFLWPRRKLTIRKRGVKKQSTLPIFPGYIFLESKELDPDVYQVLKKIRGFFRFLKNNQNIEPLTGADRRLLLHFLSFGEIVDKSTVYFDENKKIRVIQGPLKGLEGSIIKVDKRKGRAKVKLHLYDESFLIDFGFEAIEPAEVHHD